MFSTRTWHVESAQEKILLISVEVYDGRKLYRRRSESLTYWTRCHPTRSRILSSFKVRAQKFLSTLRLTKDQNREACQARVSQATRVLGEVGENGRIE